MYKTLRFLLYNNFCIRKMCFYSLIKTGITSKNFRFFLNVSRVQSSHFLLKEYTIKNTNLIKITILHIVIRIAVGTLQNSFY